MVPRRAGLSPSRAASTSTAAGARLLGRLLRLAFARLYAVLAHRQGPIDAVQFEVETAGVADGLALVVAPPEGRGARAAVRAAEPEPPRRRLEFRDLSRLLIRIPTVTGHWFCLSRRGVGRGDRETEIERERGGHFFNLLVILRKTFCTSLLQ